MVETSEFRVGNYILYNNMPAIVQGMSEDSVLINGNAVTANDASIRPIRLCDTILQKIRQRIPKPDGYCYFYYRNKQTFIIYVDDDDNYYIGLNYQGDVCRITPNPIVYLHQLQNIYFAQYGIEMDINERILLNCVEIALEKGEL
jgi:hypothetical protein